VAPGLTYCWVNSAEADALAREGFASCIRHQTWELATAKVLEFDRGAAAFASSDHLQ
jgi:hypothetical protein